MARTYSVITTAETTRIDFDADGTLVEVTIPAGTVVNTVLWDGETPWHPGEGLRAVPAE